MVAADDAVFWAPETRVGILGAADLAHRLVRQLPYRIAMELLLVGTQLSAQRAHQLGLVSELVPVRLLEHRATELAEKVAIVNSTVDNVRSRR